jgi:hypothetical protein
MRIRAANTTILFLSVCLILLIYTLCLAQSGERTEKWKEDLDYLVKRLEIMHPNLYANVSKEDFRAFTDDIRNRIPEMSDAEVVFCIQELVALVRDGHTDIAVKNTPNNELFKKMHGYPIWLVQLGDGLTVWAADEMYSNIVGQRVIRLGNVSAEDAMKRVRRIVPADNISRVWSMCPVRLSIAEALEYLEITDDAGSVTLLVTTDEGGEREVTIEAQPVMQSTLRMALVEFGGMEEMRKGLAFIVGKTTNPVPLYMTKADKKYWCTYLPDHKALYLNIREMNHMKEEPFGEFCNRMFAEFDEKKAELLIIDIRDNFGGNHIELPLFKGILARPHIDRHDRLFLIIGRDTFSAAQHLTTVLTQFTNITVVGEPTAGKPNHYGAVRTFELPNYGLPMQSSIVYHQDATPWEFSITTKPHVFVYPTSEDYKTNNDPCLERIFSFDEIADLFSGFESMMATAYEIGGIPALKNAYFELKNSYAGSGFNFEYPLLSFYEKIYDYKESIDDYRQYLEFIVEEYPDSMLALFALGVRYYREDKREMALDCFRKILEIDPSNGHARRYVGLMSLEDSAK